MINGIIFDVDGVLLDSMGIWMDAGARYLKNIDVIPEDNLGNVLWDMSLPEGAKYIKERYGLDLQVKDIFEGVLGTVRDFYFCEAQLKAGVKEFLMQVRESQIPMVIATTGDKGYVEKAFTRLGILTFFKGIVTPEEAGAGKTEPKIYEMAAAMMGIPNEDVVVFEDVLHAIKTANRAGFHTIGVYDRFSEKDRIEIEKECDFYIKDFKEYDRLLEEVRRM